MGTLLSGCNRDGGFLSVLFPSCPNSRTHVPTLSKFGGGKEMGDEGGEVCIVSSPSTSPTAKDAQQAGVSSQGAGGPR